VVVLAVSRQRSLAAAWAWAAFPSDAPITPKVR
jgi:hypothetical protein